MVQFANNMQQDVHEFLTALFSVLQLPRHQGRDSWILKTKSCNSSATFTKVSRECFTDTKI